MNDRQIDTRPAELALLRGVFDRDTARKIVSVVNNHHFGNEDTLAAWKAFRKLYFAGIPVTADTLPIEVADKWGESIDAAEGLVKEILGYDEPKDVEHLIRGVGVMQSRKRLADLKEFLDTPDALRDGMKGAVAKINEFILSNHEVAAKKPETLTDALNRMMGREGQEKVWTPGFGRLDHVWKIRKGSYGIIAGDSGSGKTSTMINMILSIAKQDTHVGVISIEMSTDELTFRAAAIEAGVDAERVEDNTLSPGEKEQILAEINRNRHIYDRIHVIDPSAVTAEELQGYYNDLIRRHGCEVIFLDYIQRVGSKNKNIIGKTDTTTQASETITAITKATGVATVALSVLNRASFAGGQAGLGSLKHSGQLGHDAAWVVLVEKEESSDVTRIPLTVRTLKNRKGRWFQDTLSLNGPTQKITIMESQPIQYEQ